MGKTNKKLAGILSKIIIQTFRIARWVEKSDLFDQRREFEFWNWKGI